jgi:creatinine amidohydrolase
LPFGGTLSLGAATFARVLDDLVASAAQAGARRVFLLNGHGGNTAACAVAAAEGSRRHGLLCASAIYTQLADTDDLAAPVPGHAGRFETAMMLAVGGRAVLESARPSPGGAARRRRRGLTVAEPGRWAELDGFTDDPSLASAELGAELLRRCAEAAARAFEEVADLAL